MRNYNEYMRGYMLKRYHSRRAKAIENLGGRCFMCGSLKNLQFDHIDPKTKSFTIGKLTSVSESRFVEEIGKCQLLCQDCHDIKTIRDTGRRPAKGNHGTVSSYRYCKCSECREAWSKWGKEYRRRRRSSTEAATRF